MNKNTFSYKLGFKKGIEIYNQNSLNGYFADEDNQKLIKRCKYYADTGYKNNTAIPKGVKKIMLNGKNNDNLILKIKKL